MLLDRGCRFAVLPFGDSAAQALLASLTQDEREGSMHIVDGDGRVWSGGDGLVQCLRIIPGGDSVAEMTLGCQRLRAAFGWGYRLVADRRRFFSRLVPNLAPPVRRPRQD